MTKKAIGSAHQDKTERLHRRIRLPGFILEEDAGLGDVIQRTSSYFGLRPCGGCGRRADALNRWLGFTNRQSK